MDNKINIVEVSSINKIIYGVHINWSEIRQKLTDEGNNLSDYLNRYVVYDLTIDYLIRKYNSSESKPYDINIIEPNPYNNERDSEVLFELRAKDRILENYDDLIVSCINELLEEIDTAIIHIIKGLNKTCNLGKSIEEQVNK